MTERARFYRYGGIVVRLYRGELRPVRLFGSLIPAQRSAKHYAPLPAEMRREIRARARQQAISEGLEDLNVTMPSAASEAA